MPARDPRPVLATLLAGLDIRSGADRAAHARLVSLLERSTAVDDLEALVGDRSTTERAGGMDAAGPEPVTASGDELPPSPEFYVFRREAPIVSPASALTVPAWARGAEIAETVGPLRGTDGRLFWYDFYRIVRLVPVYFAGDPLPAFLFHLHERPFRPGELIDVEQVLSFFRQNRYALDRGSVWIRADLLAAGSPPASYVGLKVSAGSLAFSPPVTIETDRLTIPAGGTCSIHLDLEAPAAPAPGGGASGKDAADATIYLPGLCEIGLANRHATITRVGDARWTLYGQPIGFSARPNPVPTWEPALLSVFVPFTVSEPAIELRAVSSPFATPQGRARIERGGWTLPVATIDVAHPIDAAGIGGLAVRASEELAIGWRGLRDGLMSLPSPWVALAPGLILVTDTAATGVRARQRLRLWQESNPPGRSTVDLRYAEPGQLIYLVAATGAEVVIAPAAAQARLDRPVDVRGTPLPVDTRRSLAAFTYTDAARFAFLYDEDILIDVLKPGGPASPAKGSACALAIRNALFTTTPVNSLLLFATMRDEEMIATGVVILGMGLYTMLPTLPDPYAANVAPLGRNRGRLEAAAQVTQLLVASVTWQKAASNHKPDDVHTAFAFAPVGTQAQSLATWGAPSAVAIGPRSFSDSPPPAAQVITAAAVRQIPVDAIWDSLFADFAQEQFALLDVSTNADQLGVSFAYFDPRRHPQSEGRPFDEVYGGGPAAPVYPLEIHDLDLSAQGRFVQAFTVPQISWDPILNLTEPDRSGDPPKALLLFPNDGGPTRLLSDDTAVVPIAPIPVSTHLVDEFATRKNGFTGALFTLPYGLVSFAEFSRENQFDPALGGSKLTLNRPQFEAGDLVGGIQLRADAPAQQDRSPTFRGCTVQLSNLSDATGAATGTGTLGASVSTIFNEEFFLDGGTPVRQLGVPLTRIDFSGYGASTFSHWEAPKASIASTSQARFDVFVGRTAHEVIQVRTLLYPWGVRVVRTITLFRASSGYTYRYDSGWQPESDGLFNFGYVVKKKNDPGPGVTFEDKPSPYEVHPGVVRGVFKVRNIHETDALPPFETTLNKANGDTYIDQDNFERIVDGSTPIEERAPGVLLQPVYFDGDIQIDGLTAGGMDGRVPSKGILGYVQLKPRGEPILPATLRELLDFQFGSIGAAVDCEINVAGSGQRMRVSRVDISPSVAAGGGSPIFVVAARGALVLSSGGAWSVVRHDQGSGEVSPVDANATVPLIRRGRLNPAAGTTDAAPADLFRVANPIDLVRPLASDSRNYGLLQTTGTQKALFRQPSFQQGVDQLLGAPPDYADAYRLVNTKGIFPNVQDAVPLALGAFKTSIIKEGYKLIDQANPASVFEQLLPAGPLKLIDESFLKIYVEYEFAKNDKNGTAARPGVLQFGFDAAAAEGQKWLSKVNDIGMVIDLGSIKRLVTIKGRFDAKHGEAPAFRTPELVFSDELQPVIDILQILVELQGGDYAAAMQKGLDVAMSNSAESWNYAFHARKEFPVVQFPPGELYYAPQTPLKLQAHLALGAYFNESLTPTTDVKQLIPTAGAFLEFGGSLSVMCVSLAAATVYAVGTVDLRISGDTKAGPGLAMRFGFGAELVVGLPVVGNVSLLYMVGVEVSLDLTQITVSAFLLFRGRAELLGGIVTITIQIEAKGSYQRLIGPPDQTNMIAQVTFAIDVSIFLVINLHFSKSWQEQRQIA
jgi:hypothetical protein